ncbi:MAG: zinc ABC transporter substrate-binding protein [Proteobacteria bacterium]|nr:zinc ABC transporter substrate-binding protein [Pseudomonadota bacterium]
MAWRGARILSQGGGGPRAVLAPAPARALALALAFALWAGIWAAIWAGGSAALAETRNRIHEHRVVVSVLPLHSLVSGVMAGLGVPKLLVRGASSPHDTRLRPSDARALTRAQVVIWAGPTLESFLIKALEVLARDARVVTLTEEASLRRLPQPGSAPSAGQGPGAVDPHLWLDPVNAQAMVAIFAAALAETDPDNAEAYRANATRLAERLDALDAELRGRLAPVRQVPYLVFHDATAYFAARYRLNQVGAFAVNPEIRPGARHLSALRRRIRDEGVACVFIEPQFSPALVEAVTGGTAARVATLDPLGAGLAPGPEAYFALMRALADDLLACLRPAR